MSNVMNLPDKKLELLRGIWFLEAIVPTLIKEYIHVRFSLKENVLFALLCPIKLSKSLNKCNPMTDLNVTAMCRIYLIKSYYLFTLHKLFRISPPDTQTNTETDKNGLWRFFWKCSYSTETKTSIDSHRVVYPFYQYPCQSVSVLVSGNAPLGIRVLCTVTITTQKENFIILFCLI